MTIITDDLTFCVQYRRYDEPAPTFRFHYYRPAVGDEQYDGSCQHPFDDGEDFGPGYLESERHQVLEAEMVELVQGLERDYRAVQIVDLPEILRDWIFFNICPIEWHRGLLDLKPELVDRITVWIKETV